MSSNFTWVTPLTREFMERDYLLPGQSLEERVDIIAKRAQQILGIPGFVNKFIGYMQKGYYSLSTPIWSNFGTERGLPISCFGSFVEDDMASILYTQAEIGMMSKYGGGTSATLGELRGRGAAIRNNGLSSGSVHFAQLYDKVTQVVSQGGTRRGNCAVYLPIEHPDIAEFLTIRSEGSPLQDISFGITVTDQFMRDMIGGDKEKRKIWAKVLEVRKNTGYPYIVFIDTANRKTPYTEVNNRLHSGLLGQPKDYRVSHSNLCVTGDQMVVCQHGLVSAKMLYESGDSLTLWDNKKSVQATPMQLIEQNADVYRITLANGMEHTVTGYHRVPVRVSASPVRTKDVAALQLKVGDLVAIQTETGTFGDVHRPDEAFLLGMWQANGTAAGKDIMIDVWEHSFDLIPEIVERFEQVVTKYDLQTGLNSRVYEVPSFRDQDVGDSPVAKKRLQSRGLRRLGYFIKGVVPDWMFRADEETLWQYMRGLYYADGTVNQTSGAGEPVYLSLNQSNKRFLQQIQLLLANLGINASLGLMQEKGERLLPDGKGGKKVYPTKESWRLVTGNKPDALRFNKNTGFLDRKGVVLEDREYRNNTKKFHAVVSVEYVGMQDVYCTTVDSDEHHFVCNGFVTHNCSEIMLPNGPTESFVCDLMSMNILHFDEWKDTDAVEVAVMLLDAVMTEFIDKASKIPFLSRAALFAQNHRALGLGWLGWHSYLQSKMVAWESFEAKMLNVQVAKTIQEQATAASVKLADMFGAPPVLERAGIRRRNTTLTAIAPTKSSAFILGQVSEGIEPHRSNYYIKDLAKGKFSIKNPALQELFDTEYQMIDQQAAWDSILKAGGSVQHLPWLKDEHKAVFKTFAEISPKEIIIQAAARQNFIDQSQSLNLMIGPDVPTRDINSLYIFAWEQEVKSLYYQFSVNAAQQFARNILDCASCQA